MGPSLTPCLVTSIATSIRHTLIRGGCGPLRAYVSDPYVRDAWDLGRPGCAPSATRSGSPNVRKCATCVRARPWALAPPSSAGPPGFRSLRRLAGLPLLPGLSACVPERGQPRPSPALVTGGRLHARRAPHGPAPDRRHALLVEPIGDRLQGHSVRRAWRRSGRGARGRRPRPVVPDGRLPSRAASRPFWVRSLSRSRSQPETSINVRAATPAGLLTGVEPLGRGYEPRLRACEPVEDLAQVAR